MAGADGLPLAGAAGQRRLLALLALLAVAGEAGLRRDKLVGLLWPDSPEERARHSLTQALYSARRVLGADDLFLAAGDVRLNRERLGSDVQEFTAALDAGELEQAVTLYDGAFLDGFYLAGSAEFEQWSALQRTWFEDLAIRALDQLADRAEGAGDVRAAVVWRKRVASIRPLDSAVALKLMRVLAEAGDRAGALQYARLHELLLREQLGLDPDPAVVAFAEGMRDTSTWVLPMSGVSAVDRQPRAPGDERASATTVESSDRPAPAAAAVPAEPEVEARTATVALTEVAGGVARPTAGVWPLPARLRRRLAAWAVGAAVLAGGGLTVRQLARRPDAPAAQADLRQKVVVAPFRVAGASESLAYLRDGMVELLSTRLADDSAARSVDAGAVLAAWRAAGLAGHVEVPRDTVVRLAKRLGAERVVVGNVVGTPSRLILSAAVVSVDSNAVTDEASVEGPADSVMTLVDRLAAKLLVLEAGEDASLASHTTESLRGLRAFLDGQAAFREADYTAAQRQYDRALQADSTFALAAVQLVRTGERLHTVEGRDAALALAWRNRGALSERERALLAALTGPRFPQLSSAAEQLDAWEHLVALAPGRADAWYEYGARLVHDGPALGVPLVRARATTALQRALAIDPGYGTARALLTQLTATAPPDPAGGEIPDDRVLAATAGPLAPFVRWRAALARNDTATLRRLRDTLPRLGPANLRAIAQAALFDAVAGEDGRRALRTLRDRGGRPGERVEVAEAEHALATAEGRLGDARDALERLRDVQPGSRVHLRLRVLDALYGDGGGAAAQAAVAELQRAVAAPPASQPARRATQLADACVLAQWRLASEDTADVRRIADMLRAEPGPAARPPIGAAPAACAELVDAALAVVDGRADAMRVVDRVDSLAFTADAAGDASAYAPLFLARLYARSGQPQRALAAIRKRPYMAGWPRYLATMLRDEGRYAALAGQPALAASAYQRFLALRDDPDPDLAAQVDSVRQALGAPSLVTPGEIR